MEKLNFNKDWEFCLDNFIEEYSAYGVDKYSSASGGASKFYDYNNWEKVDLPHDWAVALPYDLEANKYAGSKPITRYQRFMRNRKRKGETYNIGWYRKQFFVPKEWEGKRVFIEFEGVYRDSTVWVNAVYLDRHFSGYTTFTLELTDHLIYGEENSVAVRVDSDIPEGWWYEGAGIYRNVNIYLAEPTYFKQNKTVIVTKNDGSVKIKTIVVNDDEAEKKTSVDCKIIDKNQKIVAKEIKEIAINAFSESKIEFALSVNNPFIWDLDNPNLYTLELCIDNEIEKIQFGFREIAFDTNEGFFLNGKAVKVRGACVHQDFGGVGVAVPDNLIYYKISKLKEMGCNAYRSSHHAPSPVLLKACDELGMLVMDETRMFGTGEESVRQLVSLIERDRNHPSVFIWSLGNEEFAVQNQPISAYLMKKVSRIAKKLDPTRSVTYGGNNGEDFVGANSTSEIRGVNYIRNKIDADEGFEHWLDHYHFKHPDQPILGTEESSYVLSRGGAVNDLGSGKIDSTGNVTMMWGSTPKGWVKFMEEHPYFAGSFMWTGFDYRGEPNPFYTTNVSSSFGTIDLCGMEKPPFYYYKAWWTDEPVLKLTPHWNFKKGEKVNIAVMTNCERITLKLNGKVIDEREVERFDMPVYNLTFEKGTLEVEGKRAGKKYYDAISTSSKTVSVKVTPVLLAETDNDISVYEINAYDKNGNFNATANEELSLSIRGGKFVGVGNGDPASYDYEQKKPVEKVVQIRHFGYENGDYAIPFKYDGEGAAKISYFEMEGKTAGFCDDYRLVNKYTFENEPPTTYTFIHKIDGVKDYQYLEFERLGGEAEIYLNGKLIGHNKRNGYALCNEIRPYRFYCNFRAGENEIKVVSVLHQSSPPAMSGYVKVGKLVDEPWSVKLHYGKARLFVKTINPSTVKIQAKLTK